MTCPACTRDRGIQHLLNHISRCSLCDHIWQTDLTPTTDYGPEYADRTYLTYGMDTAYLRAGFVRAFVQAPSDERILDVGYGSGSFLTVMVKSGYPVCGIDVHTRDDGIPRSSYDAGPFAAVTFFDSLEHIQDISFISQLKARHLFVSVPCTPPWFSETPRAWKHFKPGEHLHYFSTLSLSCWAARGGYRLERMCDLEDCVRGTDAAGATNIITYHLVPR